MSTEPRVTGKQALLGVGEFVFDPGAGELSKAGECIRLEPQLARLLLYFVRRPRQIVSRAELMSAIWPGIVVADDTLARSISKLRRALGDDPRSPTYIETLPKRGYRFVGRTVDIEPGTGKRRPPAARRRGLLAAGAAAALALAVGAWAAFAGLAGQTAVSAELLRAEDRYLRFTRDDNQAAILLFTRLQTDNATRAEADAGLARALVQQVVRWPEALGSEVPGASSLREALSRGLTTSPEAQETLERAERFARRATRTRPDSAKTWHSLGLVLMSRGRIDEAASACDKALSLDPQHVPALLASGEIAQLRGSRSVAIDYFERAYEALLASYAESPRLAGDWLAPLGMLIADEYGAAGMAKRAADWRRRVQTEFPLYGDGLMR